MKSNPIPAQRRGQIQSPAPALISPGPQIFSAPPNRPGGRYRVRVGNKMFEGDDTRNLIRLAVQARRSQVRPLVEVSARGRVV